MAIEKRTINELRDAIKECIGQNAILKTAEGRNRIGHVEGTLVGAYHDYFLVRENKNGTIQNRSSRYVDVLTNISNLSIGNNENCTSILDIMGNNTGCKENL